MKNKILTISIIFILLSFIFISNNVFAATPVSSLDDIKIEKLTNIQDICAYADTLEPYSNSDLKDNYDLFIIKSSLPGSNYNFMFFKKHALSDPDVTFKNYVSFNGPSYSKYCLFFNGFTDGYSASNYHYLVSNDLSETISGGSNSYYNCYTEWVDYNTCDTYYYYSTCDIYKFTDNVLTDDVFFYQTPVTLEQIMVQAGKQATLEVTQIILTVIMITVGLIILLIGLKKGLKVLMNGFRH